jgi:hypothetical protein
MGGAIIQRLLAGEIVAVENVTIEKFIQQESSQGLYSKVGQHYYVFLRPQAPCSSRVEAFALHKKLGRSAKGFIQSLKTVQ